MAGQKLRFEIFKRDGFACQYCGRTPPLVKLELDHITPRSQGGDDDPLNLITACFDCNRGKGDKSLSQVPRPLKDQIAEEQERAAQLEAYNAFLTEVRKRADQEVNAVVQRWCSAFGCHPGTRLFPDIRMRSVRTFLKRLPMVQVFDAIEITLEHFHVEPVPNRRRARSGTSREHEHYWRYFCGVCWHKIKGTYDG